MDWMNDYLKGVKEYAKDYVLENTGLKVLALLITGVLWLSVASRPVSQVTLSVPIEPPNLADSANLIVSKYDPLTARVDLEGSRDVLDALRLGQLAVSADMSGVEPGVRVIPLNIEANRLPAGVRVKEIEPRAIRVTVERVIEREVPVTPRFEGDPRPGYERIDWQIVPPTVKIAGAESQVRDITEVSTETVNLTNKTEPFSEMVAIDIGSPNLSLTDNSRRKVMLSVNIGEQRKERVFDVPVALFDAPPKARVLPRSVRVTVFGPHSDVDSMSKADLNVGVQYQAGARSIAPKVTVSPSFADRVVVRSVEPGTVRAR